MKKSLWTILVVVVLGTAGQACESFTDFDGITIEKQAPTNTDDKEDEHSEPGG